MSKTSFVQRSIIQMQSRSGNKCHLQCPQQANAIAKPNLRRYLALWSTARAAPHLPRCVPSRRRLSPECAPPTPAVLQETLSGLLHAVHIRLESMLQHLLKRSIGIESEDSIEIIKNMKLSFWGGCKWYIIQVKKIIITNPETPKDRLFISNCFELPSDWLSQ